ncbi:MAG: GNAT family N-acetyltransferase [Acidobacteriota bacterium]
MPPPLKPAADPDHGPPLNPVWVGRFEVTAARGNEHLAGYTHAFLWIAARAADSLTLKSQVASALHTLGLTVVRGDDIEEALHEDKYSTEVRKLIREAKRNVNVICGPPHGFEAPSVRPPTMLQLKTERLLLRPWLRKDRDPFAEMNADREVMRYFIGPMSRQQSDEAVDRYLAAFDRDGFSFLVAEMRDTKAFAGVIGLQIMSDILPNLAQPAFEIGWRLNREHQGRGLATEGGHAIIKLAFENFFLDEVVAITAMANTPSRRVMEKLGMKHRTDFDFLHPRMPPSHLYARHTLYQLKNPKPFVPSTPLRSLRSA